MGAVIFLTGVAEAAPTLEYMPDYLAGVASPTGYLRVLKSRLSAPISHARVTFETGSVLPLYQENEEFFIALADTEFEGERLCAFPVMVGGARLAWVSAEQNMVFAHRGSSCNGRFYLRLNEELPVIGETAKEYEVVIERMGRLASVRIPKQSRHIRYVSGLPNVNPIKRVQEASLPPVRTEIVMVGTNRAVTQKESETSDRLFSRLTRMFGGAATTGEVARSAETGLRPLDVDPVKLSAPTLATSEWPAVAVVTPIPVVKATPAATATPRPAVVPTPALPVATPAAAVTNAIAATEKTASSLITGKTYPLLVALVALVLLAAAGGYKLVQVRKRVVVLPAQKADGNEGKKPLANPAAATLSASADFSGSLTSMSMSVLAQMLNSEQATGVLSLKDKEHNELGSLTFVNGEIVDAQSLGKKGAEAVLILIRQKQGSFLFIRKARLETKKTVYQSTVSLLLEAAKMSDEKG